MFAQRLKELRKLNGLSQAALSSLLGVTQQAVGNARERLWVRGGTPGLPLADSLLRHTQHFGNLGLAVPFGLAGLFQALCKHRKSPFYSRVNHILYAALIL